MTKQEIFSAISSNPAFYLATAEGNQPHVRCMFLYRADEEGILFHTATTKSVYHQIIGNNKVELCFSCGGCQIRICGMLEIIDDDDFKDEIAEHPSRKFMKAWKENGVFEDFYKAIAVFRLKNGVAETWSMETNFAAHEKIQL